MTWRLELKQERTQNAPTLAQAWPQTTPIHSEGIHENSTYWWHLTGEFPSPYRVELKVNGMRIDRDIVSPNEIWFRWDVGFNAGFADVEISGLGGRSRSARVVVDPARSKLNRDHYETMLRDIFEDTRWLASTSGLRRGVSRGSQVLPIATVEYVLEHAPRLRDLVSELNLRHRRKLRRTLRETPLRDARGVTSAQWTASRRGGKPASTEAITQLPPRVRTLVQRSGNIIPKRVHQAGIQLDSARREHREILGLVLFMQRLLKRTARDQKLLRDEERDEVLLERCLIASRQLREVERSPVLAGLQPMHAGWAQSHLYQNTEPYRSLYRVQRDVRSGVSSVEGDFTHIPLRETFRLYETWVALRLSRAAKLVDPGLDAAVFFTESEEKNKLTFSVASTAIEFLGHTLRFKPQYEEVWISKSGLGSYSRVMIPDIVLEPFVRDRGQVRLIVLDSKYRVEVQLNDAITSIHTYKDALIQVRVASGTESADVRVVGAGLVVVPNFANGLDEDRPWTDDRLPAVLFRRGYQDRFKIGALVMKPGVRVEVVAGLLRGLLDRYPGAASTNQSTAQPKYQAPANFTW